ncbi:MAG: hypothetical protein N2595_09455 [bacterium]|nr:hypothetical protein [bacterium]
MRVAHFDDEILREEGTGCGGENMALTGREHDRRLVALFDLLTAVIAENEPEVQ